MLTCDWRQGRAAAEMSEELVTNQKREFDYSPSAVISFIVKHEGFSEPHPGFRLVALWGFLSFTAYSVKIHLKKCYVIID